MRTLKLRYGHWMPARKRSVRPDDVVLRTEPDRGLDLTEISFAACGCGLHAAESRMIRREWGVV
jgi:hypothetical protein